MINSRAVGTAEAGGDNLPPPWILAVNISPSKDLGLLIVPSLRFSDLPTSLKYCSSAVLNSSRRVILHFSRRQQTCDLVWTLLFYYNSFLSLFMDSFISKSSVEGSNGPRRAFRCLLSTTQTPKMPPNAARSGKFSFFTVTQ